MGQGSTGNVICAIASLCVSGLGQLLQGRVKTALWHFFLSYLLFIVGIGVFIWIYSIYDAAVWDPKRH